MIEIIPAIDIIGGKCVRLSQGDYNCKSTYDATPLEMALKFEECGVKRLHIVDLDGAKSSSPKNLDILKEITENTNLKVEWGGGIKGVESLNDVFVNGADYAIIGSIAAKERGLFKEMLTQFGGDRIILGADLRGGKVSVNGWQEDLEISIEELVEEFAPFGLREVICTDISKDGMLSGPSFGLYTNLQRRYPSIDFTVSGGVSSMRDIEMANELGLKRVIVGKAIYEKSITLKELELWLQRG